MNAVPTIPSPSSFRGLIGVAREDITAPVGIYARSWGAAKHDVAEGVHRPLTLTCVAFQSTVDESPLVLIAAVPDWLISVLASPAPKGIDSAEPKDKLPLVRAGPLTRVPVTALMLALPLPCESLIRFRAPLRARLRANR